ncbi:hypothetical protein RBSWK_04435 [Rhodopirellula baltica SWK14]|uniref:Uncharacterized protein n=1 Tax=Rhodopirellula baltica SWK14 TaxID=993516 RepID=L7CDC7_RHOBT|nr:hypothetical protein RBSWK_04435 [Rhodopirellula baltica SWK14]
MTALWATDAVSSAQTGNELVSDPNTTQDSVKVDATLAEVRRRRVMDEVGIEDGSKWRSNFRSFPVVLVRPKRRGQLVHETCRLPKKVKVSG